MNPEELLFAKTHEWVHVTDQAGTQTATVGISAFAVEQLNDLVYVELPQVGQEVKAGQPLGEIESVKAVSDIYSPVSGTVTEVNSPLADALDTLKDDAYQGGWMVKIKMSDAGGLADLMDYATYTKQCAEEG